MVGGAATKILHLENNWYLCHLIHNPHKLLPDIGVTYLIKTTIGRHKNGVRRALRVVVLPYIGFEK